MASLNIYEDKENKHPDIYQKDRNKNSQVPNFRGVLGNLENKPTQCVTKHKQIVTENSYDIKPKNEKCSKFQTWKKPIPVVPVAQFEAFKVYEDKHEDIQEKKNHNTLILKETNLDNNISIDSKCLDNDVSTSKKNDENIPNSPMSIDKSLVLSIPNRQLKNRQEREIFFEMPEYRSSIHKYLREAELRNRPKAWYMKKQPDITNSMRTILVDWLVEVAEEYRLQTETLYLAVSYIDRFLSYMSVVRAKLQLVGTAAMFIASKYEEIYPPDVGEFVYITDDTYNKKQVLRMEQLILKVLAFDLSIPTPLTFLTKYCVASEQSEKVTHLAMYLCELSMLEADPYLQFLPSMLAASAVCVARDTLQFEPWISDLETITMYTCKDLQNCIKYLNSIFINASSMQQQAIQEKYKASKYQHVAMLLPRNVHIFKD